MNLLSYPDYVKVYVDRNSEQEAGIRESNLVIYSGIDQKGYYVGACLDQSEANCRRLCIHGAYCNYSMRPGAERK